MLVNSRGVTVLSRTVTRVGLIAPQRRENDVLDGIVRLSGLCGDGDSTQLDCMRAPS